MEPVVEARFTVTVWATDPPPGWANKVGQQLHDELELLYGDNVMIERQ